LEGREMKLKKYTSYMQEVTLVVYQTDPYFHLLTAEVRSIIKDAIIATTSYDVEEEELRAVDIDAPTIGRTKCPKFVRLNADDLATSFTAAKQRLQRAGRYVRLAIDLNVLGDGKRLYQMFPNMEVYRPDGPTSRDPDAVPDYGFREFNSVCQNVQHIKKDTFKVIDAVYIEER
jgi:hypothetical protein